MVNFYLEEISVFILHVNDQKEDLVSLNTTFWDKIHTVYQKQGEKEQPK